MTLAYSDLIITLVIVAVVLFAAHRLGQANPMGTGKLSRRLSAVELKVAEQGTKLDSLDRGLEALGTGMADTARSIEAMRVDLSADRGLTERSWAAIDRLQGFFIEDALKGRSDR